MSTAAIIMDETTKLETELIELGKNDQELNKEIQEALKTLPAKMVLETVGEFLKNGFPKDFSRLSEYWYGIIMKNSRPAYSIINNEITFNELDGQSAMWIRRLETYLPNIKNSFPAIGRINVEHHSNFSWVGTGWFVADNIVVTARHVATMFAGRDKDRYSFLQGVEGKKMKVYIDLLEEEGNEPNKAFTYEITDVLYITAPDEPDLAFLLADCNTPFKPSSINTAFQPLKNDSDILTVGYPGLYAPKEHEEDVDRIFRKITGKKRITPGKIKTQTEHVLYHDCSALGGMSGGVILNPANGEALGLHFGGEYFIKNYAVPAKLIAETLKHKVPYRSLE